MRDPVPALFLLCGLTGCPAPGGDPNDPLAEGGASGTLYWSDPVSQIRTWSFEDRASTLLFEGSQPEKLAGDEILFADDADTFDPWVIAIGSPDGSTRTDVATPGLYGSAYRPRADEDGARIAYTHYVGGFNPDEDGTKILDRGGAQLGFLPGLFDADWTPDDRLVLAGTLTTVGGDTESSATPGIYITDAALGSLTRIDGSLNQPQQPAVSPDGERVAFVVGGHLWVMGVDGSEPHAVTAGPKQETHPRWSPDGEFIACISYGTFEESYYNALAVVPADPEDPSELSNDSAFWIIDEEEVGSSSLGRLNPLDRFDWK